MHARISFFILISGSGWLLYIVLVTCFTCYFYRTLYPGWAFAFGEGGFVVASVALPGTVVQLCV